MKVKKQKLPSPKITTTHQEYDQEEENFDTFRPSQQPFDPQYAKAFKKQSKGKKAQSNSYFLNAPQYQGTNQIQDENEQQIKESEEQDIDLANDGIKQALNQLKRERQSKSKLLEQDFRIIDEEDNENLVEIKKQTDDGNAEHLKNQLNEYTKLIQIRNYSQKSLEEMKRFPSANYPQSEELKTATKETERTVLTNLDHLIDNYWHLANKVFCRQETENPHKQPVKELLSYESYAQKKIDVCTLWEQFQNETKFINKQIENQLIRWSQKTSLLRNHVKGQYNSLIMQTPIGQTKKVLGDWERVSKKSQQKRSAFKVLFKEDQTLKETYDRQIFDDFDFYQQVQKQYEKHVENDEDDFRISDTMKHLKERSNRNANKVRKDVDRRASKNRKLRFNVHPKLLNFMPSQLDNTMEGRDEIVENIFNSRGRKQVEEVDYIDM